MEEKIRRLINDALLNLNIEVSEILLEHPDDAKNGDYSTNVALAAAKAIGKSPKTLAEEISIQISRLNTDKEIERVAVAGPGFINFYLSREFFAKQIEKIINEGYDTGKNDLLKGRKIMVEYTDPNPFKPFHIGHLMTNAIGESIARILEHSGAKVARANYQGDIGLHVAKAIYGLLKDEKLQKRTGSHSEEARNIGLAYVDGADLYESDKEAKEKIDEINKKLYDKSDPKINELYDWGFKATMQAFEDIYDTLGTQFDFYFLESQVAILGQETVKANLGDIFEESDGAIVFKAEKYDPKLHTRVFITSKGLPTYETKELGLTEEKFKAMGDMDLSIVITANEQMDYMKVVSKALSLIHPDYEARMKHITHGMMRLESGKMSSRKGNVVTGESLLNETIDLIKEKVKDREWEDEQKEIVSKQVGVSALKYSILKQSIGGNIIFDFEKSISFEGDSGPYLQYSFARANSVIEKAKKENILPDPHLKGEIYEIEKVIYKFENVVQEASREFEPHYIANYLITLARSFNSFYANNIIANKSDENSQYKVAITYAFSFVMKTGLGLLGIEAPKKM